MNRKLASSFVALMMVIVALTLFVGGKSTAGDDPVLGVWVGKTVILPGEEPSDSFMGMMAVSDCIFMELKADGFARLQYIGTVIDTTWEKSGDGTGSVDFDGMIVDFSSIDGELHLYLGEKGGAESLEYTLEAVAASFDELAMGSVEGSIGTIAEEEGDSLNDYDFHPEYVTVFEGDWYGVLHFDSGMGAWEALTDATLDVMARFAFRNGKCEAFFAIQVDPDDAHLNFNSISTAFGTNGISISGIFLDIVFDNTLVRESETQPAIMYLIADDGTDGYDGTLYLRPWGEAWTADDEYQPTTENAAYVGQATFEEIALALNADLSIAPEPTNVSGKRTDIGSDPMDGDGDAENMSTGDTSMNAFFSKYDLDAASNTWVYTMSSDRLSEADLLSKYEIISNTPQYTMDYADIVALIGADPSGFRLDGERRIFEWETEESSARNIRVAFANKDGEWLYEIFSKTNM